MNAKKGTETQTDPIGIRSPKNAESLGAKMLIELFPSLKLIAPTTVECPAIRRNHNVLSNRMHANR